jgi:hypothetical protein
LLGLSVGGGARDNDNKGLAVDEALGYPPVLMRSRIAPAYDLSVLLS